MLLITYKAVRVLVAPYICELVQLKQSGPPVRSDNLLLLKIPNTILKSYGDIHFNVAEPNAWNHTPEHVRSVSTIGPFKSKFKTYLFDIAFDAIY